MKRGRDRKRKNRRGGGRKAKVEEERVGGQGRRYRKICREGTRWQDRKGEIEGEREKGEKVRDIGEKMRRERKGVREKMESGQERQNGERVMVFYDTQTIELSSHRGYVS